MSLNICFLENFVGTKNEFESSNVKEPSVFESSRFNCSLNLTSFSVGRSSAAGFVIRMALLQLSFRKHAYSNILKISPPETESFQIKILIFIIFLLKI